MSSRQQAAKQATKLPQFPARKSATSLGQSPMRRSRVDSLPGVPSVARSPTGRPASSRSARTGAEMLQQLGKRNDVYPGKCDSFDDDSGGVDGFESPQLAKARAQVARDEVLSYMHHRRYQRKDAGEPVRCHKDEARDTYDDSDAGDGRTRGTRGTTTHIATSSPNPDSPGDSSHLLHRVEQALDRWLPGRRVTQQHHSSAEDDLRPTSADQSPTRHDCSYLEISAGGGFVAVGPASGRKAEGRTSMQLVAAVHPRGCQGTEGRSGAAGAGPEGAVREGASLSEGQFAAFKRELAARVIQTHWRQWQDWKAKMRREAEERILQQLLADGSGLSLQLLLSGGGGGGSGGANSEGTDGRVADCTASVVPLKTTHTKLSSSAVASANLSHTHYQAPERPAPPGRLGGGGGVGGRQGRPGAAGASAAGDRIHPVRPASAAAAMALSRGKSPARVGRVTAPGATSPGHGARLGSARPAARSAGYMGRDLSFDPDELVDDFIDGTRMGTVQPSRRHTGGHAVYTFVATPQKQVTTAFALSDAAAAADAAATTQAIDRRGELQGHARPALPNNTPPADSETATVPSSCATSAAAVAGDDDVHHKDAATVSQENLRPEAVLKSGPCLPSPSRQCQPSLDADTNPAMASPALSTCTPRSSGDSAFGSLSTAVASAEAASNHARSQPAAAATAVIQESDSLLQVQQRPLDQCPHNDGELGYEEEPSCRDCGPQHAAVPQKGSAAGAVVLADPQQQLQQLHNEPAVPESASPPISPVSAPRPPMLQPDLSPSPQRIARMQALQRLKLQGSLRGTLNASGAAASRQAAGQAPLQPHPPAMGAVQQRATQGRSHHLMERQREGDREQELGPAVAPSRPQPQQLRTRRRVLHEAEAGEAAAEEGSCEAQQPSGQNGCREQASSFTNGREQQQQRQLKTQIHGDADARGQQRRLLDRSQHPRQQLPSAATRPELLHHDLSEEASLRALQGAEAGLHQRRPASCSPRLQPRIQEPAATTPCGLGPGSIRLAPMSPRRDAATTTTAANANAAHAEQWQLPQHTRHAASAQPPSGRANERSDLIGVHADRARVSQHVHLGAPVAGVAHTGRPFSAADAERSARSRGEGEARGSSLPPRSTFAGDEGTLSDLSVRSQLRELQHAAQRPTGRRDGVTPRAWSDGPARPSATGSPADEAVQARGNHVGVVFGASGSCHAADVAAAAAAAADAQMPSSDSLRIVEASGGMKGRGDSRGGGVGGAGSVGRGVGSFEGASVEGDDHPEVAVEDSLTARKMSSILKYLDEVEMQAEQEATCAALAPALLVTEHPAAAAGTAAVLPPPGDIAHAAHHHLGGCGGGGGGHGRRLVSSAGAGTSAGIHHATNPRRPGTAHATTPLLGQQQLHRSQAALSHRQNHLNRRKSRCQRSDARSLAGGDGSETGGDDDDAEDDYDGNGDDDNVSMATLSTVAGMTSRPAFLAESVYENVRAKIRRLQDDIKQRDGRINELSQEIESLQSAQRTCLLDADARLTEMLAAQRAEYEAAVSRHMAFVDRLLVDKESLSSRVHQLTEQLKSADERQERTITKLKEGWAAELKRQKENWAAAEKQRRDAWMQSKATEIKDVTVKGLEGEVQKLLARHRAELSAAQQAAADEAKRHLDAYVAQNEAAVRQLKERMSREAEEAVEKERAAAATRLREVSERYEQQLQTQRMRLVADADLRLEQLEQARKEDKKRYEEAVSAAKEAGEVRLKEAEEGWRWEKEAVRKAHEKQIDALREQYETGQEGWRAAMAERARKEVSERVAAIREKLLQERNEEVQAVMTRLEAEHAAAVEALKEDFRRREEAAAARASSALKEARRAEAKMAERFRNAGVATKAAEERLAASELTVNDLRRELESRNNTIRWLESQVSAAKDEAAARERDVRSLGAEKAAVAAEVAAAVARDKQHVEARLAQALQETQDLRTRHSAEMAAVEARVRATLARKDEVINGLREQMAALASELRNTQEVLRQQQEELGGELDASGGGGGGGSTTAVAGSELYGEAGGRRGGRT